MPASKLDHQPHFPCRFKETSNNHHRAGWCYGLAIDIDGPYALVLYDGIGPREVRVLRLHCAYFIELEG